MEIVVAPLGLAQVNGAPFPVGGVMLKLIAPVGCAVLVPATPVTIAVKVVVPARVGLADALRVISGLCFPKVIVSGLEVPAP